MNANTYWPSVDPMDASNSMEPSFGGNGSSGSSNGNTQTSQSDNNNDSHFNNNNDNNSNNANNSSNENGVEEDSVTATAAAAAAAVVANVERAVQVKMQPDEENDHHSGQQGVNELSSSVSHHQHLHHQHQHQHQQLQQHHNTDNDPDYNSKQSRPLSTSKRAQQNRQAQRAFRQRKEMYVKELEAKVQELKASKDTIDMLRQENIQLRDYILSLQSRLIEHPGGVPTPPSVYARQQGEMYEKNEKWKMKNEDNE